MPVKIEIPEALLAETKRFYLDKAYGIINRMKASKAEFNALQPILTQLGIIVSSEGEIIGEAAELHPVSTVNTGYNPKWTWLQKSKYALEKQGPMTSYEVVDVIKVLEPTLNLELLRRSIPATLSVASNNPANSGITRLKNSQNEWKYELKK